MKNYLVALLALLIVGLSALSWKQYQELVNLRASSLGVDERADLKKRAWDAETRSKRLEQDLAAAHSKAPDPDSAPKEAPAVANRPPQNPFGNMMAGMMGLMNSPDMQRLMTLQQKGQIDGRFAGLFKQLHLNPEQLEQFKNLIVERQMVQTDVMLAAAQQGMNPMQNPKEIRDLMASAQGEVDGKIKSLLGDDSYAKFQDYQQTQPQRGTVNQLQQSLSYTDTPLTTAQSEQLVQILTQTAPARGGPQANMAVMIGGPGGGPAEVRGGGGGSVITNEALALAQGVLSAPQIQAMQQLQQQQQAQQQLGRLMMQNQGMMPGMNFGAPAGGGGGGAAAPARPPGGG